MASSQNCFRPDFEARLDGLSSKRRIEPRGGVPGGADLFGDGSVVAVDLPGHADGQFGLLFPKLERPLLYAVDAQWLIAALVENRTPGLPASLLAEDAAALEPTSAMLRRFLATGGEVVFATIRRRRPTIWMERAHERARPKRSVRLCYAMALAQEPRGFRTLARLMPCAAFSTATCRARRSMARRRAISATCR